jgi:undecaprenyl-diphosphatase
MPKMTIHSTMRPGFLILRMTVLLVGSLLVSLSVQAQGQGDYKTLRGINPRYPDNPTYKTFTSAAYPVALGLPIGIMAVSLITDNEQGKKISYEMMGGLVLSAAGTGILKQLINRPRPYETYTDIYPDVRESGNAFPSGHTSLSFSTATTLLLTTKKWYIAAPAYMWGCGVGYSRMYLGQHYPSDVVVGAATGAAGAYLAHVIRKKWFSGPRKRKLVKLP